MATMSTRRGARPLPTPPTGPRTGQPPMSMFELMKLVDMPQVVAPSMQVPQRMEPIAEAWLPSAPRDIRQPSPPRDVRQPFSGREARQPSPVREVWRESPEPMIESLPAPEPAQTSSSPSDGRLAIDPQRVAPFTGEILQTPFSPLERETHQRSTSPRSADVSAFPRRPQRTFSGEEERPTSFAIEPQQMAPRNEGQQFTHRNEQLSPRGGTQQLSEGSGGSRASSVSLSISPLVLPPTQITQPPKRRATSRISPAQRLYASAWEGEAEDIVTDSFSTPIRAPPAEIHPSSSAASTPVLSSPSTGLSPAMSHMSLPSPTPRSGAVRSLDSSPVIPPASPQSPASLYSQMTSELPNSHRTSLEPRRRSTLTKAHIGPVSFGSAGPLRTSMTPSDLYNVAVLPRQIVPKTRPNPALPPSPQTSSHMPVYSSRVPPPCPTNVIQPPRATDSAIDISNPLARPTVRRNYSQDVPAVAIPDSVNNRSPLHHSAIIPTAAASPPTHQRSMSDSALQHYSPSPPSQISPSPVSAQPVGTNPASTTAAPSVRAPNRLSRRSTAQTTASKRSNSKRGLLMASLLGAAGGAVLGTALAEDEMSDLSGLSVLGDFDDFGDADPSSDDPTQDPTEGGQDLVDGNGQVLYGEAQVEVSLSITNEPLQGGQVQPPLIHAAHTQNYNDLLLEAYSLPPPVNGTYYPLPQTDHSQMSPNPAAHLDPEPLGLHGPHGYQGPTNPAAAHLPHHAATQPQLQQYGPQATGRDIPQRGQTTPTAAWGANMSQQSSSVAGSSQSDSSSRPQQSQTRLSTASGNPPARGNITTAQVIKGVRTGIRVASLASKLANWAF